MTMLSLAAVSFVGTHFLLSHPLRRPMVKVVDLTTLTGWLSPSAAAWIARTSTWSQLYPAVPILVPDPATGDLRIAPPVVPFLPP